jgi:very-short-patch-repair endonuclease
MAAVLGVAGSHAPGEHAAFLSHLSAAHLWRMLPTGEGSVHVSLRGDSGRAKRDGIRVHRTSTLTPGEITRHLGIPVTTPSRTIADLRSGRRHDRISASRLRTALRQAGVLGLQIDAIDRDPTRSELERTFLHVCRACRLPAPEVNVEVDGMEVDFLWRSRCLVVETDGYRFHRGRAAFEEDRRRDLRLRASGMQVVRIGYEQLMREPQQAADVIQTILTGGH